MRECFTFARRYGNDRWFDHDLFFCIDHSISAKTTFKTGYSDSGNDENRKKDLSDSIDSKCTCCTLVGILQMAVYGIIWHLKGLSVFGDVRVGESHQILTGAISFLLELICYFIWP